MPATPGHGPAATRRTEAAASPPGLWHDRDFQKIFTARISASFGSMLGGIALAAILLLDARPAEMAALGAFGIAPGLIFGLSTGVWADRLRRRPLLAFADLGRVAVITSVPVAYFLYSLHIEHLYLVAFLLGTLRTIKEIVTPAYLPALVGENRLFEANAKISAGLAVVETTGFTIGGWIAQLASAVVAVIVQGAAYLIGGIAILSIRRTEPAPEKVRRTGHLSEIGAGFAFARSRPILGVILASNVVHGISDGILGGQITLFAISEVGFGAGLVGSIYAIGGISSLLGAMVARRLSRRFGFGTVMAFGWIIPGVLSFLYPFTTGPVAVAALMFALPQLGDSLWVVHDIGEVSLRQTVTPESMRARINSLVNVTQLGAQLVGLAIGGLLAETLGLRFALAVGAALIVVSGLMILGSRIRLIRSIDEVTVSTGEGR